MLSRSPRVLFCLAFVMAACASSEEPEEDRTCQGAAPYVEQGPFVAGVTTVQVGGVPVEVWYPVEPGEEAGREPDVYDLREWLVGIVDNIPDEDAPLYETIAFRDLPVANGRFPVLLFSHGLGSYRSQSSFLTAHLATWGFVVAAPDHVERGIKLLVNASLPSFIESAAMLRSVLDHLQTEDTRAEGRFFGHLATERTGVFGHSAGATSAFEMATDSRITAYAGLAGGKIERDPSKPVLLLAASRDSVVPAQLSVASYELIGGDSSKQYLELNGAGHQAFSDICDIAVEHGGLLGLADKYGLTVASIIRDLAEDGCRPSEVKPSRTYPITWNFVTAHFRYFLGVDSEPTGLDQAAASCFGNLLSDVRL